MSDEIEDIQVDNQQPETEASDDHTQAQDDHTDEQRNTKKGNAEAAKYRRQLRQVEAERDQLQEHLERFRQAEIAEACEGLLSVPKLLFINGKSSADYYDDNGKIDMKKLQAASKELVKEFGDQVARQNPISRLAGQQPNLDPRAADPGDWLTMG